MRLSYQWINEYIDVKDVTPEDLAEKLTSAGLEVDAVVPRNQGVSGVVVGEVVDCVPHPNADRLRVCQVNVGESELRTIVCGAPNVQAGMRVATALPGSVLPGGGIGVAKLRGVESQGMLCSAKEIGLETKLLPKEQTEGLYVLPVDAPIGRDVVEYLQLDDVVIDIGLTANRSDCLSMRGFAYELGAILNRPVQFPENLETVSTGTSPVTVRIDTPLCSRYDAQVLSGVSTEDAPIWMQMRLMAMGIRPINLIVDVTNYVMLEWGQPLHAFDFDKVHDRTIVVRQGEPDEQIVTLDGDERALAAETIVIADPDRAIGIAGVMGGENSEISARTKQVILESAVFHPTSVRRTGQRLGLRSEAQQRFEKGIDQVAVRGALVRATQLLTELSGAVCEGGVVSAGGVDQTAGRSVPFSPERCNGTLGTNLEAAEMAAIFARLGFTIDDGQGTEWTVTVPSRRPDITLQADLVEEVCRLIGYDKIPSTLPHGATTVGVRTPAQKLRKHTREVLLGCGMNEVLTYSLTHPSMLDKLRIASDSPFRQMIPLRHPISEERSVLRTHMLPALAELAAYNQTHGVQGGEIFEVGRVYWPQQLPLVEQPCERTKWVGLWFGEIQPDVGERARSYDFYDAKGVVETWLQSFGWLDRATFRRDAFSWLHPGRSAAVLVDGEPVGSIGELHPETADAFGLGHAVYVEFDLDALVEKVSDQWRVERIPRFPGSRRDLAVLVRSDVAVADLIDAAFAAVGTTEADILRSCEVFDVYTGKGIPDGMKSLALALTYRSEERTLTDEETGAAESKILSNWTEKFGAQLRSS